MYSQNDLDEAVASGALSAESATALRSFVERQRALPLVDEEHFRLITGFNDIFVSIAAAILLFAVGWIGQSIGQSLDHDRRVVVELGLELHDALGAAQAGGDRERADVVREAGVERSNEVRDRSVRHALAVLGLLSSSRAAGNRPAMPRAVSQSSSMIRSSISLASS